MCTLILFLDDTPTQQELTQLDVPDLNLSIRIKDRIRKYETVGIFLLNDDQGVIMSRIEKDHNHVEERIDDLFNRWITGQGQKGKKKSNTWKKLVESLKSARENYLADDIDLVLKFCEDAHRDKKCIFGNTERIQEKSRETDHLIPVVIAAAIVGVGVIFKGARVLAIYFRKGLNVHDLAVQKSISRALS